MRIANGSTPVEYDSLTLFAFDDHSLPNSAGLRLRMVAGSNAGKEFNNPAFSQEDHRVLTLGPTGAPDDMLVIYYGNVFVGPDGLLWMYYLAQGSTDPFWKGKPPAHRVERLLLAKSKDGHTWTKPSLGLVDYNGSTSNNIVKITGANFLAAGVIFYEADEPDKSKAFKMVWENQGMNAGLAGICTSFSADGLTWTLQQHPEIGMEMSGCCILEAGTDGTPKRYLVSGHGGRHYPPTRRMIIYQSYDFKTWEVTTVSGFCRTPQWPQVNTGGDSEYNYGNAGEQCHLGAALKKHNGVVLGMYGQWHGHHSNDRRLLTMDLGFVVSNDGLHYREPLPDFRMVPCAEDISTIAEFPWASRHVLEPTVVEFPANVQGNGMENVGDLTLFWYGKWPEVNADGVRCVKWDRDRLGYLAMDSTLGSDAVSVVSCVIDMGTTTAPAAKMFSLNLGGASSSATATVELLTEQFVPIPGFSAGHAVEVTASGLRQPVEWRVGDDDTAHTTRFYDAAAAAAGGAGRRIRVKVTFGGAQADKLQLYAIYVDDKSVGDTIPGLYVPPVGGTDSDAKEAEGVSASETAAVAAPPAPALTPSAATGDRDRDCDPPASTLALKIRCAGSLRRVAVPSSGLRMCALREMLPTLFGEQMPGAYSVHYTDDEGDRIVVGSDVELDEAFRLAIESGKALKLEVSAC